MTKPHTEASNTGSDTDTSTARRSRSSRPERIVIGDDELVRNDLIARALGTSERTINRGDSQGAPYTYIGGVKYRPLQAYHQFLSRRIQHRGQPPQRRRRRTA